MDLIDLFNAGKLNLNPPYQRNDIWPTENKKRLIDSIKKNYPLPMFFLHKKADTYDMVDGQQRTRAVIGYMKYLFPDLDKNKYTEEDDALFKDYFIGITLISGEDDEKVLQDFFYRVNKFGTKLNRPEIWKAQFNDTEIQKAIEDIADDNSFKSLNLFSDSSIKRMMDFDFIGELLSLMKYGITDKKDSVEKLYKEVLKEEEVAELKNKFSTILQQFVFLNSIYDIEKTRYSQRNDFYSLWSLFDKNPQISSSHLSHFYKILVLIDGDISPTKDEIISFQEYAINCVSQSNSKRAREERLRFYEQIIFNEEDNPLESSDNLVMQDLIKYYQVDPKSMIRVDGKYFLPDIRDINKKAMLFEDGI